MILGDICTRSCRFCGVSHGLPSPPDANEPSRVAELISRLELAYVVVTSVDRDDLPDGGASHWAETIRRLRTTVPETKVEALIPDFEGEIEAQETVLMASPDVLSHNVETVEALQSRIRPHARYRWSLGLLQRAATEGLITKSGLMVGLGETKAQIRDTLRDLADVGVSMVTVGQYLQPSERSVPVARYWALDEFEEIEHDAEALGLALLAGPLVRSSYLADELARRCWNSNTQEARIP
jgi:lipoic acid synthetase